MGGLNRQQFLETGFCAPAWQEHITTDAKEAVIHDPLYAKAWF